jgi:hypothetical protein
VVRGPQSRDNSLKHPGRATVMDACYELGCHITHSSPARIYAFSKAEFKALPLFTEVEEPFYEASWYIRTRLLSERTIRRHPSLLLLRLRVTIRADMDKSNHIARLLGFSKITDSTRLIHANWFEESPILLTRCSPAACRPICFLVLSSYRRMKRLASIIS